MFITLQHIYWWMDGWEPYREMSRISTFRIRPIRLPLTSLSSFETPFWNPMLRGWEYRIDSVDFSQIFRRIEHCCNIYWFTGTDLKTFMFITLQHIYWWMDGWEPYREMSRISTFRVRPISSQPSLQNISYILSFFSWKSFLEYNVERLRRTDTQSGFELTCSQEVENRIRLNILPSNIYWFIVVTDLKTFMFIPEQQIYWFIVVTDLKTFIFIPEQQLYWFIGVTDLKTFIFIPEQQLYWFIGGPT